MIRRNRKEYSFKINIYVVVFSIIAVVMLVSYFAPFFLKIKYVSDISVPEETLLAKVLDEKPIEPPITHIKTPESVKAIYISSWVAGSPEIRKNLIKLIDETEINAVVIDIKDYTGKVVFKTNGKKIEEFESTEVRIRDIRELIKSFHDKGVYVIGRISAFQDAHMVVKKPDWAVKRESDSGVWKDRKGISWIDPGSEEMWDYLVEIGRESFALGFDELNFDYIRFPSDGDMNDIYYPFSDGQKKVDVMGRFYAYLNSQFRGSIVKNEDGINVPYIGTDEPVLSADLFGMVTSNYDDLNIGQVIEVAFPYFDYIAPMVYPSHYPKTFLGFDNPSAKPYEVIHYAMSKAVERAKIASTSPSKLRPWLQDFSLGTTYTPEMVRAQIQATYDTGLNSWMLWSASNKYTQSALHE
jgi:hypothetical protein